MAKINNNAVVTVASDLSGKAGELVTVNTGETGYTLEDPSAISGGRWQDGDAATDVVLETSTDTVGIGTTNPASKLHVETTTSHYAITLKRSEQGTGDVGLNMEGGTGGKIWYVIQQAGSDDLTFWDSNGDAARVTYKSGGNVGIGNTAPATTLHIGDDSATTATVVRFETDDAFVDMGIAQSASDMLPTANAQAFVINNNGNNGDMLFGTNDTQRMIIDVAGNVGIGTDSDPPNAPLEVVSTSTQLQLSYDGTDNCTLGVDDYGMLTVTPSGGTITNTAANGVINSAALRTKGAHTHPDTFIKNTHLPVHGSGTSNNWLYVSAGKYSNSQLTAPSSGADAIRLIKWQPASAYTDTHIYLFILPTLDATWSSSSNYVKYRIVIQQDTSMGSISGVQVALQGEGGSDTINGSTSDYAIQNIGTTAASAYDWTCDVVGYFDGSITVWEVVQKAQWS